MKLLLRRGADVNKANETAADLASKNYKAEVGKMITEYTADDIIRNKIRSTTLDTAEHGTNKDGNNKGEASLHAAAEEGNIDVVESLLERGVDVNCCNENDETLLDTAAAEGEVDVVRLLVERGAELNSRDTKWSWAPQRDLDTSKL